MKFSIDLGCQIGTKMLPKIDVKFNDFSVWFSVTFWIRLFMIMIDYQSPNWFNIQPYFNIIWTWCKKRRHAENTVNYNGKSLFLRFKVSKNSLKIIENSNRKSCWFLMPKILVFNGFWPPNWVRNGSQNDSENRLKSILIF